MQTLIVISLLINTSIGLRPLKLPHYKNSDIRNLKKVCTLPIWYGKTHIYHSSICTRIRNIDFMDSMTTTDSSTTTTTSTSSSIEASTLEVQMEESEKIKKNIRCRIIFKPLFLSGYMPSISCFDVDSDPENEDMQMTTESSLEPLTTKAMTEESSSFLRY